jgi:peptide/nickel transport system permease protein
MSQENKRFLNTVARRIIFAGLVILGAWLLLFALRGFVSDDVIVSMNQDMQDRLRSGQTLSLDSRSWDWSTSLFRDSQPASGEPGRRLVLTLQVIALIGGLSLVIAATLLFLGFLISRATQRPTWLARVRSALRLLLVSGGASIPFFAVSTLVAVFFLGWLSPSSLPSVAATMFWMALFSSVLPTWLLVQAGHGEMSRRQEMPRAALARHMAVYLVVRLLNLIGVVLMIGVFTSFGVGRLVEASFGMRDFPLMFRDAWSLATVVVLVKLAADVIELTYDRFSKTQVSAEPPDEGSPLRFAVPKAWLILSLGLVGLSVLVAAAAPALAPYGWNEIMLQNRLAPPGPGLLLGADNVGRDIFSRVLAGIRVAVFGGGAGAAIVIPAAAAWAMLAEWLSRSGRRTLERLVTLPVESLRAFPWLTLVLLFLSLSVQGVAPAFVAASLAILPRAVAMIREAVASSPAGQDWRRSLLRAAPMTFLFTVPGIILYVSAASQLGLGVPPPYPEFGNMLSGAGRQFMMTAPWMALWPPVVLTSLLFIWVMAGDALLERMGFRSKELWSKTME